MKSDINLCFQEIYIGIFCDFEWPRLKNTPSNSWQFVLEIHRDGSFYQPLYFANLYKQLSISPWFLEQAIKPRSPKNLECRRETSSFVGLLDSWWSGVALCFSERSFALWDKSPYWRMISKGKRDYAREISKTPMILRVRCTGICAGIFETWPLLTWLPFWSKILPYRSGLNFRNFIPKPVHYFQPPPPSLNFIFQKI